jgi:hypothetical protein
MTDRIEPALTEEEWANNGEDVVGGYLDWESGVIDTSGTYVSRGPRFIPALIALANAALSDSDPRKITREMVDDLRMAASGLRHEYGSVDEDAASVDRVSDVLESYLPPEP